MGVAVKIKRCKEPSPDGGGGCSCPARTRVSTKSRPESCRISGLFAEFGSWCTIVCTFVRISFFPKRYRIPGAFGSTHKHKTRSPRSLAARCAGRTWFELRERRRRSYARGIAHRNFPVCLVWVRQTVFSTPTAFVS